MPDAVMVERITAATTCARTYICATARLVFLDCHDPKLEETAPDAR
jgi:hypothetical protein